MATFIIVTIFIFISIILVIVIAEYLCDIADRHYRESYVKITFKEFILFYNLNKEAYVLNSDGPVRLKDFNNGYENNIYIYFDFLDMVKYKLFMSKQNKIEKEKENKEMNLIFSEIVKKDKDNQERYW